MKKKIAIIVALVLALLMPSLTFAGNEACDVMDKNDPNYNLVCGSKSNTNETAQAKVKSVLDTVYLYVGIFAVVVIVIGAFYYMTSQGDPARVTRGKNAIMYAVIGLVVDLLAFAITSFVISATTGNV